MIKEGGIVASNKTMTTKKKMVKKTNKPMTRAPKIKMVDFQSMKARIAARAMRRKIAVKVNTFDSFHDKICRNNFLELLYYCSMIILYTIYIYNSVQIDHQ